MFRQLFIAIGFLAGTSANAAVVVNIYEDGGNVVSTYSGTINLDGVSLTHGDRSIANYLNPHQPAYYKIKGDLKRFHEVSGSGANWMDIRRPFGPNILSSFAFGDILGFRTDIDVVYLDEGYTSGSYISGGMTFDGYTLADLGLNVGVYDDLLTWGSGANADSISVNIGPPIPSVPLPASLPLLAMGVGAFALARRRKKA